jgi:hypothetical protein
MHPPKASLSLGYSPHLADRTSCKGRINIKKKVIETIKGIKSLEKIKGIENIES